MNSKQTQHYNISAIQSSNQRAYYQEKIQQVQKSTQSNTLNLNASPMMTKDVQMEQNNYNEDYSIRKRIISNNYNNNIN